VANERQWKTRYFDFEATTAPRALIDKSLKVRGQTGALNVREGMPTLVGAFRKVIDVLNPGSEATVHEIREWHSTGYMWAKIIYGT
jgi:hypothetical protein